MKSRIALAVVFAAVTVGTVPAFAQLQSTTSTPVRPDMTEIDRLRAELTAAQRRMTTAQQTVRVKFEAEDDYIDARKEIADAQREYNAAREPVLAKLRETDEYRRANEEARLASDRVDKARDQLNGSPTTQPRSTEIDDHLLDAAQTKLEEKSEVSRLEAAALEKDSAARGAKANLAKASEKMSVIRTKYQAALLTDPDWSAARQDVDRISTELRTKGHLPVNPVTPALPDMLPGTNRGMTNPPDIHGVAPPTVVVTPSTQPSNPR